MRKEITDRYLGSSSALLWVVVQPVATLFVYYLVFGFIFKARVGELPEELFITYLAVGLWPWMAFSEAVLGSLMTVLNRKDLLGKVKFDLRQVLLAGISSHFILHGIGYLTIIVLLMVFERLTPHWSLFLLILPYAILYLFAIALAFLFSSLQVFYRDLKQIVTAFMPLWFFTTPIIYAWSLVPEAGQKILAYNPLLPIINFIHSVTFNFSTPNLHSLMTVAAGIFVFLLITHAFFQKLAPRFDDFV
ncbi:ABC transporter permease [Marinicella gelatinilytica]|uniref:ABC transporter permease n=1 Tax=Marinicella gelatinilytica TaxID=2996017 RepID=UPI002260D383|nr:ABC transporter permease [Marinicella gelatinilytica]MCX7544073.1 ABC transporter permease [Marinicella gelatinilytica]